MSHQLNRIYQEQLLMVGVPLSKAEQAAQNMTPEQLIIIGEIWADWGTVLAQLNTDQVRGTI